MAAQPRIRFSRVPGDSRSTLGIADLNRFPFSGLSDEQRDPITVMLIEEYEMVVDGLAAVMGHEPDIDVVGGATTGAEALRLAFEIRPQVAVVSCRLSDADGAQVTRQLRRVAPDVGVVMLMARVDELTMTEALAAGCTALIAKNGRVSELLRAVRAVAGGYVTFPSELARNLPEGSQSRAGELTARELEILELLMLREGTSSTTG